MEIFAQRLAISINREEACLRTGDPDYGCDVCKSKKEERLEEDANEYLAVVHAYDKSTVEEEADCWIRFGPRLPSANSRSAKP